MVDTMRCLRCGFSGLLLVGMLTVLAAPALAQPAISQLDAFFPNTTAPGGAAITAGTALPNGFSLQITGSGFTSAFVVNWIDNNNAANNRSFSNIQENAFLVNSNTILVPAIPAGRVAVATSITVQVVVGSSPPASAPFTVNAALPATIPVNGSAVVLPDAAVGGNYAEPLFPTGDGTAPFTISLQSGSLPAGLPIFSPQGTVSPYDNFYVGSPTTAGVYTFRLGITDAWGNSTALPYSLTIHPAPVISSFNPPIIPAGSLGFTLTVNGANFTPGLVVSWRSALTGTTSLATTYVSATRATAVVPANLIQSYDLPVVRVTVPGGAFVEADFIVEYPIIGGVTPPYVTAGHPAFTLTVTGQYFLTVPSVTQILFGGVGLADYLAEPRGPAGNGTGIPGGHRRQQDLSGAESGRPALICLRRLHRLSSGRGDQSQSEQPHGWKRSLRPDHQRHQPGKCRQRVVGPVRHFVVQCGRNHPDHGYDPGGIPHVRGP